jgi:hypothetical protein
MVKRELKNYEWQYALGEVILIDKRNKIMMKLPMTAFDSLMRAGITIKSDYALDKAKKVEDRLFNMKMRYERVKLVLVKKRAQEKQRRLIKKLKK